jgi:ATP-binding cassette subfamily F protein 3
MLQVHHICKSYGFETILSEVSFTLSCGERLGLIGPNGSGKTTLVRILAGEEQPDTGTVLFSPPALRLGYLPQGFSGTPAETLGSYLARTRGDPKSLEAELAILGESLALNPQQAALQERYDRALAQLQWIYSNERSNAELLAGLGLGEIPPESPVSALSGGQKTRLALAGLLSSQPQLLLLDEPTNHLDITMLEWLEDWLVSASALRETGILIVSHDRALLDQVVNGILELDEKTHSIRYFAGNYTAYLEQKLGERERQRQAYSDQREEVARLRRAAQEIRAKARFKKGGKADSGDKFARGFFANRSLGTIRRAKALEQRLEKLLNEDRVEKPGLSWQMKLEFNGASRSGQNVLHFDHLAAGYNGLPLLRDLNQSVIYGKRIVITGPNGVGKTTLLKTIAGQIAPLEGSVALGAGVRIGYMAQEQETLDQSLDALGTIRSLAPLSETEARTFLHQFLFSGDGVFTPASQLSYGERARLMLACLVIQGCNLLLLDEPINHLDIPSRSSFEHALAQFSGTVIAVVHDRYFIHGFANEVWNISPEGIECQIQTGIPGI